MFGCAAIPALGQLICFMFLPESPRWLYEHNMKDETEQVLMKVYCGHKEWVKYEMGEIKKGHEMEKLTEQDGTDQTMRKNVLEKSRHRYYTGHIIRSSGVKDPHTTIWISVGTAAVNFLGTFIPMALVERMGRRPLFMLSVTGVLIALLAMGTTFVFINRNYAQLDHSFAYSTLFLWDPFLRNESFEIETNPQPYIIFAYTKVDILINWVIVCSELMLKLVKYQRWDHAVQSAQCVQSDYEWDANSCKTKLTGVFIAVMLFYLLSFSSGAYYLYAGFTLVALIFIYFFVPETRGYSIDEVETLFMSKEVRERAYTRKRVSTDTGEPNITVIQLS
ncbi:hypothetical protein ANCDUO_12657 [Ancylostoma duodenale]|uniref:Major facilitator superfamily (MFS) profile domain-containing protein n=1 Tax=Ancylostoma duodenale TaxID=51022 RepID=A0A0C2GE00_9BILA|nr:hypothetical protein ANCDUO_12657 [Ancylostoma duodenale]